MSYEVKHSQKLVTLTSEKQTHEEDVEIADFVTRGYSVAEYEKPAKKRKKSNSNNKSAEWIIQHLPNDEARAQFNEIRNSEKGLTGYRKAVAWTKENHPDIFPNNNKK